MLPGRTPPSRPNPHHLLSLLLLLLLQPLCPRALICYDCHSDTGSCNEGECEGAVCVKMETTNRDNDRRTVHKSCSDNFEESACHQSGFGSKWISRCVCDRPLCNGDSALVAAGLETSLASDRRPGSAFSQMALVTAAIVFAVAGSSLLIVATICVQFC